MAEKMRIEINKTKFKDETRPAWWWVTLCEQIMGNFSTRDEAIDPDAVIKWENEE